MLSNKAFIGLVSLGASFIVNVQAQDASQDGFIWNKLETSPELKWTDCYTQLQCARLQVPLNYSNPEADAASIAVIRLPSPLAGTDDYKGPIIIIPGGPGGSGVELIVDNSAVLPQVLGANFDIVSFDPRGVGRSTPRASFFDTEAQRRFFDTSFDVINATSDSLARIWARAQITGVLAAQHNKNNIFEHFNTESTARDMLQIVEAHGQKNIQAWGFSYGTVLGATFASLFPDRIDRLVLDGVLDAEDYFATRWSNSLLDTDKTLQAFFDGCVEGGPDLCPFYESSPEAISRKLDDLTRTIFLRPVPVKTDISYGLVDYERLRITIFRSLYSPYADFPILAQGLADLMNGNGTVLYQMLEQPAFDCACGSPAPLTSIADGGTAIMCTDGVEVRDTVEELEPFVQGLLRESQWGEVWAGIRIGCTAWPKQEKRHFKGPFLGNTSHPILWIGNTADPVTPIAGAHKMAKGFPGSVVLTQDSPGHCSIAAPSVCTIGFVQAYFMNGTLPDEGVVCPVTQPIFSGQPVGGVVGSTKRRDLEVKEEKDEELVRALTRLRENFRVPTPF
ncbi:Serine protease/Carboxylesterase S33 [Pleurotus pulmonarius]